MRWRSVLSEAYRNLVSGTTRGVLFAVLLTAVVAGLAITDARAIRTLQRQAADFTGSGASVQVMVARDSTDPVACERLRNITGVRSAGALRPTDAVVLRAMLGNPIQAYAVTPGLISVLGGDSAAPAGAWLPAELARTLGVRPGQQLATTTGALSIAGVYDYPDDGRDSRLTYAALLPEPVHGTFDECWADVWPVSASREALLHTALTVDSTSADPVTVGQLNTSRGQRCDGEQAFTDRPTRYALPACALAGLLLGFTAIRLRRLEIAGALHLGESRRALLATVLIETAVWAGAAVLLAACALVLGSGSLDVFAIDVRGPLAAAPGAVLGALLAAFTIREKHLFAYFKNR
ncbi:MAG TPA: hypothetical protein VFO77_09750 [Actinoplanes sp.]|nr:hypothetical protein [Actinoplanes sp.]